MKGNFLYRSPLQRVRFGAGAVRHLGDEIAAIGGTRAPILATPFQTDDAAALATRIGTMAAGVFAEARMHTPVEVTARALLAFAESGADCLVSFGGGSTIGLGKAIAWRNDALHLVVATTYAGSEVTDILGETEAKLKTTRRDPSDLGARSDALCGSWLCGTVLGTVAMALHHKLCHTLGGALDLPHAGTHAILLPHTAGFNSAAAAEALQPAAQLFGGVLGGGLHDPARSLGAPTALRNFGVGRGDLAGIADLAVMNPYANPREVTLDGILALLEGAWAGSRPAPI